jgi:hypothetical protein
MIVRPGVLWVELFETLDITKDSVTQSIKVIKIGDIIKSVTVAVTEAFGGTFSLTAGFPADTSELIKTTDVKLNTIGNYKVDHYRTSTGTETIRVYISGTSTTGAAKIIVEFI